jgi:mannose-6-phosphate isomerase-like protein (cupin superfamily)
VPKTTKEAAGSDREPIDLALRVAAEEICADEVAKAERRLRGLTESERDLVHSVNARVFSRLLDRSAPWLQLEEATARSRRSALGRRRKRMSGYTTVRVRDVENFAPQVGLDADQYEIRLLRTPLGCGEYGVSYERYAPGWRHPFGHRHAEQEEVYVLVRGRMRMKLDEDVVELEPWTAVRVSPSTIRGLHNPGSEDAELIVIGAPATDEPDFELLADWWTD